MNPQRLAQAEYELHELLKPWDYDELLAMAMHLIDSLPEDEQAESTDVYLRWVNEKEPTERANALIDVILDMVDPDALLGEVNKLAPKGQGGGRYDPSGAPIDWSSEQLADQPHYRHLERAPGIPSREEREIMQPHPEQEYKYKDKPERTDYSSGPAPVVSDSAAVDAFLALDGTELSAAIREMKAGIMDAISYPSMPRPFTMEMVYQYFLQHGLETNVERFDLDGVGSRSRFGFPQKHLLGYLYNVLPLDEFYQYWDSIVNHRFLPLVNPEYVVDVMGGGAMGANLEPMYEDWVVAQQPKE